MEDAKTTSLRWGTGMGFVGFLGIIFFILNPNGAMLTFFQTMFGQQVTLLTLQFMSALITMCGILLLYHGVRSA